MTTLPLPILAHPSQIPTSEHSRELASHLVGFSRMVSFTVEVTSKVAPSRLFYAGGVDTHNAAPKIVPQVVSSAAVVEGDGGVGSVKLFKFTDAVPFDCLKERVELLDKENLEYTHSLIEGGGLWPKLQSATFNTKLQCAADGGSVVKVTFEYCPKPGVELTEEDLKVEKEHFLQMFHAFEAYLLANPDVYA